MSIPPPVIPILDNGQGVIDPDVYFEINEPPADLTQFEDKLNAFVDFHKEAGSKVVFITVSLPFFFFFLYMYTHYSYRVVERLYLWRIKRCVLLTTLV